MFAVLADLTLTLFKDQKVSLKIILIYRKKILSKVLIVSQIKHKSIKYLISKINIAF